MPHDVWNYRLVAFKIIFTGLERLIIYHFFAAKYLGSRVRVHLRQPAWKLPWSRDLTLQLLTSAEQLRPRLSLVEPGNQ